MALRWSTQVCSTEKASWSSGICIPFQDSVLNPEEAIISLWDVLVKLSFAVINIWEKEYKQRKFWWILSEHFGLLLWERCSGTEHHTVESREQRKRLLQPTDFFFILFFIPPISIPFLRHPAYGVVSSTFAMSLSIFTDIHTGVLCQSPMNL